MVADGMVMQGTRASATMILTKFSHNIPAPAPEGLTSLPLYNDGADYPDNISHAF